MIDVYGEEWKTKWPKIVDDLMSRGPETVNYAIHCFGWDIPHQKNCVWCERDRNDPDKLTLSDKSDLRLLLECGAVDELELRGGRVDGSWDASFESPESRRNRLAKRMAR